MSIEHKKVLTAEMAEEVAALLSSGETEGIREVISPLHATELASLLEGLSEDSALSVFKLLQHESASEVLLELSGSLREHLLEYVANEDLANIVGEMATDDATDVVSELSDEDAKDVLDGMEWRDSIVVQKLLKYPEDTAGGKMQAELVKVEETASVRDTIEEVRKRSEDVENIACVFVVDSDGRLDGTVALDKLILAKEDCRINEIVNRAAIRVSTDVDQEEVARIFQKYDLISLAVVDDKKRLVGRITVDDMVDVIEEEIFEDFYRMASLNTDERATDSPLRSFRMRSPWLLLNLLTAFIAASVVKLFEGTIESFVILAVLMPVVAGLGGNAATQTITVIIRGLALRELELSSARKVLFKEVAVGLANGMLVGVVGGVVAYLLGANFIIGVLLFLAMTANLVIAGLAGSVIPLILRWFKADPALSASIFVTAFTDVGGFFTFLGLAALFMNLGIL
ncbi:MAG: magnesium transporter [Deltaproteobacteria bacterium]|nr:magnesium transporter [Deltaproteobacteria bacterium]